MTAIRVGVDLVEIARIRRALERHGDGFRERCEIEIRGRPKPGVHLSGATATFAQRVQAGAIELSMTHSRELAAAVAVVMPE